MMTFELGFAGFVFFIAMYFVAAEIQDGKERLKQGEKNNRDTNERLDKVVSVLTFMQVILSRRSERNRYYRTQSLDVIEKSNRKKKPVSDAAYSKMKALTTEVNDIDERELNKIDELISALSKDESDTSKPPDKQDD